MFSKIFVLISTSIIAKGLFWQVFSSFRFTILSSTSPQFCQTVKIHQIQIYQIGGSRGQNHQIHNKPVPVLHCQFGTMSVSSDCVEAAARHSSCLPALCASLGPHRTILTSKLIPCVCQRRVVPVVNDFFETWKGKLWALIDDLLLIYLITYLWNSLPSTFCTFCT